jgi:3-hydroxymyristoyl/3-hydroxydecanoyl-(acyl carrier protein) dehydratase
LAVRRKLKGEETFDKAALTEMSTGLLSKALGPLYARFDDLSFVARLPRAPYDFIDLASIKKGRLGQIITGTQVEAVYDLDNDERRRPFLLDQIGGNPPSFPYAALNEIALQPCGFLSAYMGSALAFEGPMHFRNLGGEATVKLPLNKLSGRVVTKATLNKSSVLGAMVIQHYHFASYLNEVPIYEGQASFGFHAPESFTRQGGLKASPALLKSLAAFPDDRDFAPYPQGPSWPSGPWRMLDKFSLSLTSKNDQKVWAKTKVDPKAWFFAAHFPHDPVWPGSLGLEGFVEAAKTLAAAIFRPRDDLSQIVLGWTSPVPGLQHRWIYRGQITPMNREVVWGVKATDFNQKLGQLTFGGLLWVDSKVVYQIEDFSVRL